MGRSIRARRRALTPPVPRTAQRGKPADAPRLTVLRVAPRTKALGRRKLRLAGTPRLRIWTYRLWLIGATAALMLALLWLQQLLGAVPAHPTTLQRGIQWAELIWLAPVPLSLALWLGWLLFAEAARPSPPATDVPLLTRKRRGVTLPTRLVFRFATRGDNREVLRESVAAVHAAFDRAAFVTGPYRVEIVTERAFDIADAPGLVATYVVPARYATPAGSRYKARALAYLQAETHPQPEDWHIYLDEESVVDAAFVAGVYRFIRRALTRRRGHRQAPVIGQGPILYQGGHWFFRGADALRTADDLGRFRLQYALGMPLFGVHGSYLVLRGVDDARLAFDVGPRNSLTEDAAWALRAWARGYRFAWVEGYLREQPPQRVRDFVRQRARWLSGIRLVIQDAAVPRRYRACLAMFTLLWQV
ncbi:MAG TPA: glycosyltransferase family 2 protein, partial [Ktedonobacterales bacterium]|nr:glycosyltransferase family 2 protein [Ktedonobacterales bacterium]